MNPKSIIKIPEGVKIAVIGDIHEHEYQFDQMLTKLNPSDTMLIVSVGDVFDKGFGQDQAESICNKLKILSDKKQAFMIQGNHELKVIKKALKQNKLSPILEWCRKLPLSLFFEFSNGTKLTIVHGGVLPHHTIDDLTHNVEICYVRSIDERGKMIRMIWEKRGDKNILKPEKSDGMLWHEGYDGRFGYIASGHNAQKDGIAKFYNYSCNLDSAIFSSGRLTAQIFSQNGREELIYVDGPAAKPQLDMIEE